MAQACDHARSIPLARRHRLAGHLLRRRFPLRKNLRLNFANNDHRELAKGGQRELSSAEFELYSRANH